jgi:hypothetical protein
LQYLLTTGIGGPLRYLDPLFVLAPAWGPAHSPRPGRGGPPAHHQGGRLGAPGRAVPGRRHVAHAPRLHQGAGKCWWPRCPVTWILLEVVPARRPRLVKSATAGSPARSRSIFPSPCLQATCAFASGRPGEWHATCF